MSETVRLLRLWAERDLAIADHVPKEYHLGYQAAATIERLEARNARLLAALKAVVASRGRPMRDEWINGASFKDAETIHIHALEAIAAAEKEQGK